MKLNCDKEDVLTQQQLKVQMISFLLELLNYQHQIYSSAVKRGELNPRQICQYIENNYADTSLGDLAKAFGYSPNYISSVLKNTTNYRFTALINIVRINKACQLMASSPKATIGEIAHKVGYSNMNSFYRYFRKFTGTYPKKWHDQLNN